MDVLLAVWIVGGSVFFFRQFWDRILAIAPVVVRKLVTTPEFSVLKTSIIPVTLPKRPSFMPLSTRKSRMETFGARLAVTGSTRTFCVPLAVRGKPSDDVYRRHPTDPLPLRSGPTSTLMRAVSEAAGSA